MLKFTLLLNTQEINIQVACTENMLYFFMTKYLVIPLQISMNLSFCILIMYIINYYSARSHKIYFIYLIITTD